VPAAPCRPGLGEALRAAALRAPVATTVRSDGIGRYPPEVESAAKHAERATRVSISLSDCAVLRFEVRDDAAGLAPGTVRGAGLTNMRDRVDGARR
jgi:signal transduction histidine kinase